MISILCPKMEEKMSKTLAIYGAGGLGREALELARQINVKEQRWKDFMFVIDGEGGTTVNGVEVFSYNDLKKKNKQDVEVAFGIGEPAIKEKLLKKVRTDGWKTPTLIHPEVYIPSTTSVGEGVVIQKYAFISCNVLIENDVYIQPHTNIGHDCVLKTGSMLSGFCNLAGEVSIGKYAFLGISSCVKEHVSVGDYAIVSMASAVYKDIEDGVVAVGNPARVMKRNEEKRVFK